MGLSPSHGLTPIVPLLSQRGEEENTSSSPTHTSTLPRMGKEKRMRTHEHGKDTNRYPPPTPHTQGPQSPSLHAQTLRGMCGTLQPSPHSRDFSQGPKEKACFQGPGFWCPPKMCQLITECQAMGIVHLAERLPSMQEALGSVPSTVQTRHTHDPSTQEEKTGKSEVQSYLHL